MRMTDFPFGHVFLVSLYEPCFPFSLYGIVGVWWSLVEFGGEQAEYGYLEDLDDLRIAGLSI
jgi:hypothetical protein